MFVKKMAVISFIVVISSIVLIANNSDFYYSKGDSTQMTPQEIIIGQEKAILNRWITGDTFGFIEAASEEITYFDPGLEKRCTGKTEFHNWIAAFNGTFSLTNYELLDPQVQMHGDVVILTFNFIGFMVDGSKDYWNTTEVYKLIEGDWKLISSHWSQTKPKR
ncbi:MAG: nuclear transport factor 2 family protein [Bacteroidetes bacterium]|nr:nuclear transport factor 2 family protein [Bacteroidota bacterium]MBU1113814.1 nuclear transport factor 2 family protein [Bacteroidota bacterium]MBU1799600.1 nuclear transport factor 2 family protein [Bacteroidota bacterium]